MKAGVVHAREDIRYEEIQMPSPKAGQVLIKVKYTGICGSDVPRVNGDACHFFPNVLGHEFSGVVEDCLLYTASWPFRLYFLREK